MYRIGDEIKFNKFKWVIVSKHKSLAGVVFYKYKVFRKYRIKKQTRWLNNTDCSYTIFPESIYWYKKRLKKNKNYHYLINKNNI